MSLANSVSQKMGRKKSGQNGLQTEAEEMEILQRELVLGAW